MFGTKEKELLEAKAKIAELELYLASDKRANMRLREELQLERNNFHSNVAQKHHEMDSQLEKRYAEFEEHHFSKMRTLRKLNKALAEDKVDLDLKFEKLALENEVLRAKYLGVYKEKISKKRK